MSPLLFNIVADMLAVIIGRAKQHGHVEGLVPHLVNGGVSILQYADDTILFMENDMAKARNMKLILCLLEQLSGLKINFIRASCFALGRPKMRNTNTDNCLVASQVPYHSITWVYRSITVNSPIKIGNVLKNELKKTKMLEG